MTERIYYRDSYLAEFEASIIDVRVHESKKTVVLDRTAFYPTSGGQPSDRGWLGGQRVLDVSEDETGCILHHVEGDAELGSVTGRIDWDRRFDHMQQHSGQHLLSQSFLKVASAPTISFHLGRDSSTIDLESPEIDLGLLERTEQEANRIIFENRPVRVSFLENSQLNSANLRKTPSRSGSLRIIEIEGYDRSACGGTHVRNTGELGLLVVTGWQRYKSNCRVEFRCGWRALRSAQRQRSILRELTRHISTGLDELPASFQRLSDENKERGRQIKELRERLNENQAELLFQAAEKEHGIWVVKAVLPAGSSDQLKFLASKLIRKIPCLVLLASEDDPAFVLLANSSSRPVDSGKVLSRTLAAFGGRGGGRPEMAQGGGVPGSRANEVLDSLYQSVFQSDDRSS